MGLLNPVDYGLSAGRSAARGCARGTRAHPRVRAGLRSFKFSSMVVDLPKEVPKSAASSPQHADSLALGEMTSFQRGLSFSGDFLEIFNAAIEYRLRAS